MINYRVDDLGGMIRRAQSRNGGAPKQPKSTLHISSQNFERSGNTLLPGGGKSIGVGTPDQNCTRSKTDCFDNVGAAAHSAIHQHLGLTVDGGYDFRESSQ